MKESTKKILNCEDCEILLADYFDGCLAAEEASSVDAHLAVCAACSELAQDASVGMSFLADVPELEAPPALLQGILRATTQRPAPGFFAQVFGNGFGFSLPRFSFAGVARSMMQPRFAMGLAMTALSVVMIGRFWGVAERGAYRAWDRAMNRTVKSYENLAVVYDVQSQLDEWRGQLAGSGNDRSDNGRSENNDTGDRTGRK